MYEELMAVLAEVDPPEDPRDGDCLEWAPRVTQALIGAGFPAEDIWVVGYSGETWWFVHRATLCNGLVVDCTARQFHPDLEARWISRAEPYIRTMRMTIGVPSIRLTTGSPLMGIHEL